MNILKIVIHIVSAILLILGWVLYIYTVKPNIKNGLKKVKSTFQKNWRGIIWVIIYLFLVTASTIFVMTNWSKCLNLQFFDQFNGYNIIWVLWVVLLFMPLISVDNQWFKIPNPITKGQKQIDEVKENATLQENINRYNILEEGISNTKKEDNTNEFNN